MIIVGTAGLVDPHGQINLPSGTSDAQSIIDALATEYLKGVKHRLGSPTSSQHDVSPRNEGRQGEFNVLKAQEMILSGLPCIGVNVMVRIRLGVGSPDAMKIWEEREDD
jgi:hypothetical protein